MIVRGKIYCFVLYMYVVALSLFAGCSGGCDNNDDTVEHEYLLSGCMAMHPEYMLLEFCPMTFDASVGRQRFYIGSVQIFPDYCDTRCGLYKKSLSEKYFYTVFGGCVMGLRGDAPIYSVQVRHSFCDTLFVGIVFTRVYDARDYMERADCRIRIPFVKCRMGEYRCITNGLPLRCMRRPRSGVMRLFVDVNGLFM